MTVSPTHCDRCAEPGDESTLIRVKPRVAHTVQTFGMPAYWCAGCRQEKRGMFRLHPVKP